MDFRISYKYKTKPVILVEKKVMSDIFYRKII
jgi:hypothetical protein